MLEGASNEQLLIELDQKQDRRKGRPRKRSFTEYLLTRIIGRNRESAGFCVAVHVQLGGGEPFFIGQSAQGLPDQIRDGLNSAFPLQVEDQPTIGRTPSDARLIPELLFHALQRNAVYCAMQLKS